MNSKPRILIGELDPVADAEVDIDVGGVGDGLAVIEKRHVAEIDFPVEMARRAGIVGVVGRSTLR